MSLYRLSFMRCAFISSLLSLSFIVTLSLTTVVQASGFFTPPHGVRTQGRGGAGVLSAIDMNALWYNPALLAGLGKFHLTVDLNLLDQDASFARSPRTLSNGERIHYPQVDNLSNPVLIPQIGVASNLGTERFVFALGVWAPNGAPARYPQNGPQRYTIIDTEGSFALSVELAVAWRVTDWWWIGGGIQNHSVTIRLVNTLTTWPGFTGDAESEDYDLLFEGIVSSPITPSGNFGTRIELFKALQIGMNIQLPVLVRDHQAQTKQRLPSGVLFDEVRIQGDTVKSTFDQPWILRSGIRYVRPTWDIELNLVVEFWSIFDQITIEPNQITVQNVPAVGNLQAGNLSIPRNYQDTLSIRLGGDVQIMPNRLDIRVGSFWEQSAIPTQTLSVLQMDSTKFGLSLGLSWHMTPHVILDLAYSRLFYQPVTVTDSLVRQINPTNIDNTIVVGNGEYDLSAQLVGLGIRVDL